MVSGNGPDCADGVAHLTERLLGQLTRERPDTAWLWLNRRSTKGRAALSFDKAGVVQIRPWHTWRPFSWKLAELVIRSLRPHVVHIQDEIHSFHETGAAVELARSAKKFGAGVIVTLHEYHVELPSVHFTDELVALADAIVVQDRRNAERCRTRTGRSADAVGWSPSNIEPPPTTVAPIPGRLVTFGLLGRAKGVEIVYEALRKIRPQHQDLTWHIMGPFDPVKNDYHRELRDRFAAEPWITFTGGPKDLSQIDFRRALAQASLMLLPFSDGASARRTTLHAAWAFGLATITTAPEVEEPEIRDGDNCILVPGGQLSVELQVDAWVQAIENLLMSPALVQRLREGSRKAAERHSWQRLGELHRGLYERWLGSALTFG